ncbi:Cytochrome [Cardamine amara subsp. amara]|uniref:Cytochrome n=1 Tax=Cardamine amara subsp. amara TaxID=228776 RepID=A0ABD0Z0P8_CARAN
MAAMIMVGYENCFMLIFLCLFSLLCYSLFFKKPKNGFDLPPSPPFIPIIGHFHLLLSIPTHKSLQKLSSKYGPLLHLRIFNIPVVIVSSASIAYEIFKTQDLNVSSRGPTLIDDPIFAGSSSFISSPYGDHWKFMKKLLVTKLLGPQALVRSRQNRAYELERFYTSLLDKAMKEERVEIYKDVMNLSTKSICKMIMGRSCSEENGEKEIFKNLASDSNSLGDKILLGNMSRAPFRKLLMSLFKKERMVVSKRFDDLFERILVEHEEKQQQGTDLMDALLAAYRDDNAVYKITRNHIKTLLADLLFAAPESSAQATQWAMAEIINNPKIHKRLREEIDSVVGKTRLIQESDVPNLPYLQAVVKEVLRLHPPATLFGRKSEAELRIGKFYVPEHTSVIVNVYAVMRDPDSWEDPDEFKPQRFLASSISSSGQEDERREQALKYLPFGSGRRACPGANLAYVFLETTVGMMVQGFNWRINGDKVDTEETGLGLALTMVHPPKFTLVVRTLNPLTFNL